MAREPAAHLVRPLRHVLHTPRWPGRRQLQKSGARWAAGPSASAGGHCRRPGPVTACAGLGAAAGHLSQWPMAGPMPRGAPGRAGCACRGMSAEGGPTPGRRVPPARRPHTPVAADAVRAGGRTCRHGGEGLEQHSSTQCVVNMLLASTGVVKCAKALIYFRGPVRTTASLYLTP